jgi:hypothetical protein
MGEEINMKPIIYEQPAIRFEVYPFSPWINKMSWYDAEEWCGKLKDGWRLPTKYELDILYKNKDTIGDFQDEWYCSSSKVDSYMWRGQLMDSYMWIQSFTTGTQARGGKKDYHRVRFIRDIK